MNMLKKVRIKNFKSIKDSGDIEFTDKIYILAGQNESGKSSILEAISTFETEEFDSDTLNFEEENQENRVQEMSVEFIINEKEKDNFITKIISEFNNEFSDNEDGVDLFSNTSILEKITKYTITKKYNHDTEELEVDINDEVLNFIKGSLSKVKREYSEENGEVVEREEYIIDIEENIGKIAQIFFNNSPKIILFNEFADLLPDRILVDDLRNNNSKAKGYNAVRNLEKILNRNFVQISDLESIRRRSVVDMEKENLSRMFSESWRQRIHSNGKLNIVFWIEPKNEDGAAKDYVYFSIETKNNVLLEPRKRSKGMIWFLSMWLELKAKEVLDNMVLLFDEPGQHLHIKAHQDIILLFDELVGHGHQIVYSTHFPSLINTKELNRIGLVVNSDEKGTIIEGLTTSEINTEYKRDALQPIAEAMGLYPVNDFSILRDKNIILEGLSDFYYFSAMKLLLGIKDDFHFIPGVGIKGEHAYPLILFSIGYGLDWLLIMDKGENSENTFNFLKEKLFDNDADEVEKKITFINDDEVENMFTLKDFKLVDDKIKIDTTKRPIDAVRNRKMIFSRKFYQLVVDKKIKEKDLSKKSIENFRNIFKWIKENI